tara:strand:+ start:1604 stop:3046 length:1443 start_codon:yes stop_codon:yes gene_type:complete
LKYLKSKLFKKSDLIIFLFSVSIFFWGLKILNFELRFSYLLIFILLSLKTIEWKKFYLPLFIIIHSILLTNYLEFEKNNYYIFQLVIILVTSYIIFNSHELILKNIDKLIFIYFFILIILLIGFFLINLNYSNTYDFKCVFGCFSQNRVIYDENSHFAVSVIPALLYLFITQKNILNLHINNIIKFSFLVICFFNFSTTLFLGLLLMIIIFFVFEWRNSTNYQKKNISLLFLFSILIFIFNNQDIIARSNKLFKFDTFKLNKLSNSSENHIDKILLKNDVINHFNKREINNNINIISKKFLFVKSNSIHQDDLPFNLNDHIETEEERIYVLNKNRIDENLPNNLSTDVLIKSLKISYLSIKKYPLGVGFNNYQFAHEEFIDQVFTRYILTKIFNKEDGSNNFVKILTEFGIFSLLFAFVILKFIFTKTQNLETKYFLLSFVLIQVFLRGAGYFNGAFFITFLLILTLLKDKNTKIDRGRL